MSCPYGEKMKSGLTSYIKCKLGGNCVFCRFCVTKQEIVFNGKESTCTKARDYENQKKDTKEE